LLVLAQLRNSDTVFVAAHAGYRATHGGQSQPGRNWAPGHRAVATLKTWTVLTQRCCPQRANTIIAAIRVLQTPKTSTNEG
jgi:hypothetical protein